MKRTVFAWIFVCLACRVLAQQGAETGYTFSHGPYLQGLTEHSVRVYFTTSAKGFSAVEVRRQGESAARRVVDTVNGLIQANNTRNAILLDSLQPNTAYEYRLSSVRIKTFRLSNNVYSDTITTPWYTFRTPDPAATSCTFLTTSDIHDDAGKYTQLFSHLPLHEVDMVFLVGDIMSNFSRKDQPYTSFIDPSVEMFARNKPFAVVRGNHETRGQYAREYGAYVYRPCNRYYGTYQLGNTFIIMLDTGEDKPDSHFDYSGITAFDAYLQEQAAWLRQVVKSKAFRKARHRIVMAHIPPAKRGNSTRASAYGPERVDRLFMPILNREKIDLMISGHTHRFSFREAKKGENNFPILVNDNQSASLFKVSPEGIYVKTVNPQGEVTFEKLLAD